MSYSIIKMEPGIHRQAIKELWARNIRRNFNGRFNWLYEEQPLQCTKTWLALDDSTQNVVGGGTIYPRRIHYFGKEMTIGIAADFAINREHRVFGPALKLQQTISRSGLNGYECIFAYPSKASQGIFKRAGYEEIGHSSTWVKLLRTQNKLLPALKLRPLARVCAFVADKLLLLHDKLRLLALFPKTVIEETVSCDGLEDLWKDAKTGYSITGVKHGEYLKWRYSMNDYRFFCIYDRKKENLIGYIVFQKQNKVAEVLDLFCRNHKKTLLSLLLKFSSEMRKQSMHSICLNYFGNSEFTDKLKKLLFFKRPTRRTCMLFLNKRIPASIRRELMAENNWFLFEGEMDL
ncbi:hypothetical protein GF337_19950 [candidate division KSB1 bacterium]|nr:hypothetical protein [candidate division KSB1 bacterium]